MKNKSILALAACIILTGLTASVAEAQDREKYQSYVDVNGYAEREVPPDVFYMRVEINELDSKGRHSLEKQQKGMISALKSIGIDTEKCLLRLSLTSSFYNKKTNISSAVYQLKLDSPEAVSKAWGELDDLGISNVTFTKAECSNIEQIKDEVRAEAVRNARRQACTMAEAVGQKIGKCFYIYSSDSGRPMVYAMARMAKSNSMNDALGEIAEEESADRINFNNITVSVNVSMKFVLD